MNLFQKLVEIRKEVINFNKDSKSFGYKYVSGSQAIGKIRDKMDELGVLLVPNIGELSEKTYDYKNSKGEEKTDFIIEGDVSYTWINGEKPEETLTVPWKLYGAQDDISKAFGSGLTYSERYFILKFFQAPTDEDDPDKRDTKGRQQRNNQNSSKISKAAAVTINNLIIETKTEPNSFLKWVGVSKVEDIPNYKLNECLRQLSIKKKKIDDENKAKTVMSAEDIEF